MSEISEKQIGSKIYLIRGVKEMFVPKLRK